MNWRIWWDELADMLERDLEKIEIFLTDNSCSVFIVLEVLELSFVKGGIGIVLFMTIEERSMSNANSNCKDKYRTDPVLQYLKFRDNGGAARNTLRRACIFLKHYFRYLEKRGLRWQAVTVDDLADFLAWLKYPKIDEKVIPLNLEPKYRAETINAILD